MKKSIFYFIMILIMISLPLGMTAGFYAYRKLTLSYNYCEPYGQIDGEIGWILKPNSVSCLSLKNHLTGDVYFDSTIFTNELGARDKAPNRQIQENSIVFIGDSWTFGYGVNYEQSFPSFVSEDLKVSTINLGVPAYGSGSTYQLFSRHFEKLRPKVVIYFTLGLWTRSICREEQIETTLLPCYFIDSKDEAQIGLPRKGSVDASAQNNVYPGGYLTSGYNFADMIFKLKPKEILNDVRQIGLSFLTRVGLAQSQDESVVNLSENSVKKILKFELDQYAAKLAHTDTLFVLYDPNGYYVKTTESIQSTLGDRFFYFGADYWSKAVTSQFSNMPIDRVKIPKDGHFTEAANRIIAKSISNVLAERGIGRQ